MAEEKSERIFTVDECVIAIRSDPKTRFSDKEVMFILDNTQITKEDDLDRIINELGFWRVNLLTALIKKYRPIP
ncbi:MAG: hypothetical protein AAB674_03050 [Patescibacteria group bacterium]